MANTVRDILLTDGSEAFFDKLLSVDVFFVDDSVGLYSIDLVLNLRENRFYRVVFRGVGSVENRKEAKLRHLFQAFLAPMHA